eukprot:CAMPEP_0116041356 /NCGR_PEP_ID=MMETSP0321-20121206/24991_1 /TAXON_ID=163516 /ORGANISM="Leptocylindrus danicus var. danicus, Strain B650" /LENGTH=555 /DNA_ID=CAMNT_0003521517 /DNA_START=94 /DNA_END=1761 /DNA_ORIENTATION=+
MLTSLCIIHSNNGPTVVVVEAFTHPSTCTYTTHAPSHYQNQKQNININQNQNQNQARRPYNTCLLYAQDSSRQKPESKTLYQILSISPDATRSEIKKRYLELAKVLHPDAQPSKSDDDDVEDDLTFIEVSDAYRLLYNPAERKKYDRELRANALKGDIERAAENFGESAAPVISSLFESVFKPMIRKTAVTTGAVISAVQAQAREQQQYRNQNVTASGGSFSSTMSAGSQSSTSSSATATTNGNVDYNTIPKTRAAEEKKGFDLASATVAAIKAGQDAGRIVDNLELLQKAKDLEKKWQMDSDKAEAVRIKLAEVAEERLQQAILTPDSKLDAWEAAEILNSFNATDSASAGTFVDTMMLRNSVQREIDVLYEKEAERDMFQADASEATTIHRANLKAMDKCQDKLKKAKQAEKDARDALEAALTAVESSKADLVEISRAVSYSETTERKLNEKAERFRGYCERQRERVRNALQRKAVKVRGEGTRQQEEADEKANTAGQQQSKKMKELRDLERKLTSEAILLEERASRFLSRATKLRTRAERELGELVDVEKIK